VHSSQDLHSIGRNIKGNICAVSHVVLSANTCALSCTQKEHIDPAQDSCSLPLRLAFRLTAWIAPLKLCSNEPFLGTNHNRNDGIAEEKTDFATPHYAGSWRACIAVKTCIQSVISSITREKASTRASTLQLPLLLAVILKRSH